MLNDNNKVILISLLVHVQVSCVLYYVHVAELESVKTFSSTKAANVAEKTPSRLAAMLRK